MSGLIWSVLLIARHLGATPGRFGSLLQDVSNPHAAACRQAFEKAVLGAMIEHAKLNKGRFGHVSVQPTNGSKR